MFVSPGERVCSIDQDPQPGQRSGRESDQDQQLTNIRAAGKDGDLLVPPIH
jgi:hypothetical protein